MVTIQFCNFNKKHLVLAKLCANNAPSIGNQSDKFRLNPLKRTVVTLVYVRWPQNTLVSSFCGLRQTQKTWNWSVSEWPHKSCYNYCLLWQICLKFCTLIANNALLIWNVARIGCFLLELRKCTLTAGFTYVMPYW